MNDEPWGSYNDEEEEIALGCVGPLDPILSESDFSNYREPEIKGQDEILSLLYVLINRMDNMTDLVNTLAVRQEFKKARKPRTPLNRCIHRNRKNEPCCSYICKNSTTLCHAHYSLYHTQKQNYLYGHK